MRLKPFTERNPVTVALIGGLITVLLVLLAFNFQRLPLLGSGAEYRAEFTDASGLQTGEDVRIAGVKVGTVSAIDLSGNRVVATFRVDDTTLGEGTRASIEIKTLLGQHYLSLTPAGRGALPAGSTIPLRRTSTPMNVVPAFQRLTRTTEKIDTEQMAKAFDTLTATLRETAPEIRGTLTGLSRLSATIASRDEEIQQLFGKARSVTGVIASRDREISQLLTDTNSVLELLDRRKDTIQQILTGTTTLSRQLTGLVEDNRAQLTPALDKLHSVVTVLRKNDRQLDKLIKQMTVYGREFTNVGGSGRWFDATIKVPRGFALCSNGPDTPLSSVLDPILSAANKNVNGSSNPCLPLGPAVSTALGAGGQGDGR